MKLVLVVLSLLSATSLLIAKPFFENKIIPQIDCITIGTAVTGIEGKTVHDTLWTLNQIIIIQQGECLQGSSEIQKKYFVNEIPCTLSDMVQVEQHIQQELASLSSSSMPHEEYEQRISHVNHMTQELIAALEEVKQDFINKTVYFAPQVRLIKSLLCELIAEWCTRCDRPTSFLQNWGSIDNEENAVRQIKTCKEMYEFLNDLKDFLKKLIQSCPRALKDYQKRFPSK